LETGPNIILITTDQQRFDSIGINGSSFMNTPNLDRLGRQGARFTRAYCPNPVCTPSRVSMMTGNHISRHGAYNIGTYAEDDSKFLSHLLRENGYNTYHIGKAHWNAWGEENEETKDVGPAGEPFKDFMGFDQAELSIGHGLTGGIKGHYGFWLKEKGGRSEPFGYQALFEDDPMETGDWDIPSSLHSGAWVVERAEQVIRTADRKKPFFLNLGFQDPHHPHVLPSDFTNRVDESAIPLPDFNPTGSEVLCESAYHLQQGTMNHSRFVGRFKVAGNGDDANWHTYFQDEEKARKTRAYYYSMIQLLDEQIGQLLQCLEDTGLMNDTLIIFTSDHGEMLGDHGIGQKGPLVYEGVARIPLMIQYPNGIAPCVIDDCVSLVDLLPTLADFLNIQDTGRRDGISLKDRIQEGAKLPRSGVRMEYKEEPDRIRFKSWVTKEWKLAVYSGESFGELYDLKHDPGETCNLFDQPLYEQIQLKLYRELLEDMERSEPISRRPSRV